MKQIKISIIILFSATMLSTLMLAISFWNRLIHEIYNFGFWPVAFLVISIVLTATLLVLYLKTTDEKLIEAKIADRVTEERKKILAEFARKEETAESVVEEVKIKAEDIVPSGNFKSEESFAHKLLVNLSELTQAGIGIFYHLDKKTRKYEYLSGFAIHEEAKPAGFKAGENLTGQVAVSKEIMVVKDIPENYFNIESGSGKSKPSTLVITPIVNNNKTIAVIEIATFINIDEKIINIIKDVCTLSALKIEQKKNE